MYINVDVVVVANEGPYFNTAHLGNIFRSGKRPQATTRESASQALSRKHLVRPCKEKYIASFYTSFISEWNNQLAGTDHFPVNTPKWGLTR